MPDRHAAVAAPGGGTTEAGRTLALRGRRLLTTERLVVGACAIAVCAFYFWTAFSGGPGDGYYRALTDSFIHGETAFRTPPPPELLALPDPYDPAQNGPYRLHDASLYQGRWYLYFGPAPTLLYLPFQAAGVDVSDPFAVALFGSVGFLFALALMRFLIERYRPRTGVATRAVAAVLLGLGNVVPFLARRPAVYEVAISAGYCFLLIALYLTVTGALRERPSLARLAGGSLFLGLAAGARIHLLLAAPVVLWAWYRALEARGGRHAPRADLGRLTGAVLGPVAGCLALLGLYNVVRFGSLTEFGQTYQLGGIKTSTLDHFDLARLVPGLWFYLLDPPHLDLTFPFAHLQPTYPGTLSPQYAAGMEIVGGALACVPLLVLAFAAPVLLARAWRRRPEDLVLGSLLLAGALLVMAVPLLTFNGATMRYEVDWVTLMMLAALIVWLRVATAIEGRGPIAVPVRTAAALGVVTAAVFGLAFSMTGYGDTLRTENFSTYDRIQNAFDWVPSIAAKLRGEPVILESGPTRPSSDSAIRLATPSAGTATLRASFVRNPEVPAGSRIVVGVRGTDGVVRRYPVTRGRFDVRAGFDGGGVQYAYVRWHLIGYRGPRPAPEPGFAVIDIDVVGWDGR
jgi:hypothetical protein